jgi:hypothetical protein
MAILFVLLIPIAIVLFVLFDVLLYLEHKDHIEEWKKDGRSGGFFWRPEGVSVWAGLFRRGGLASAWLFLTPAWMAADQRAKRLLFWYRVVLWISMIGWLGSVIYIFASR